MLKLLRNKKTAKKIWIGLAVIIVPAFIFWGFKGGMEGKKENPVAGRIFGKDISSEAYRNSLDAVRNQAIIQFGEKYEELKKYLNLESQAWERLILLEEAKKRNIKISDQEVIGLIQSYPFLQRKDKFDQQQYGQMLQYVFYTPARKFEEQTRENLMLSRLYNSLTSDISLTEKEIKDGYRRENEEVSIFYIAGLFADFAKDIAVSDEETKDYFAKNSLEFKQSLSFNLEYVSLESEDKLRELYNRLNKKNNFLEIAKKSGLTVKETGLFAQADPIPGIGWSGEILNLLSKAKPGKYLPPVVIDKTFYIFRLKERKEPYVPEFAAVKDKVKDMFIKNKAQKMAQEKIENCFKELTAARQSNPKLIDFSKAAKTYGLKSESTALFKYGSYIEGIGSSDIFWANALKLKDDEISPVISTPSGFFIIKTKEKVLMDEKKFAAEESEFSKKLLEQKKQEYFVKFTEELKRKAQLF